MSKIYCPSCGAPNTYESAKPNFCMGCGGKFAGATGSFKEQNSSKSSKPKPEIEEDDDDGFDNQAFAGTIDIQVGSARENRVLGKDVVGQGGNFEPVRNIDFKNFNPKKVLKELLNEGKALRPK